MEVTEIFAQTFTSGIHKNWCKRERW